MKRFAELYRDLDATTATSEKVAAMARYFAEETAENAAWTLALLTGSKRRRVITSLTLLQDFQQISGMPQWLLDDCRSHVGDTAEAVALLVHEALAGKKSAPKTEDLASLPLTDWLTKVIPDLGRRDDSTRRRRLLEIWWSLSAADIFVFHKLLTGGFRVGVSQRLVVRALAQASGIEPAVLFHKLMGNWSPTPEFYRDLWSSDNATMPPSRPYPFFLASPAEPADLLQLDLTAQRVEWKWDGIRCQLVRRANEVWLWSRGEELVNEQFPEIVEAATALPSGTVLDGELVVWSDGRPLPFNLLQQRLGRKKVSKILLQKAPVHLIAYDLLEDQGIDIRDRPLSHRAELLRQVIAACPGTPFQVSPALSATTLEELQSLRARAREEAVEGLMIKSSAAPYGVGRVRGAWWKYKVDPLTLDAVLIYAQAGSGKRANLFTDYTFALWHGDVLVPFAKAYSGLTNKEIDELDRWIRRNTIEKFGPVRSVKAERVFEIAFEGMAPSTRHKSGLAVRFPRIARPRPDKPTAEADTLESAQRLIAVQPPEIQTSLDLL